MWEVRYNDYYGRGDGGYTLSKLPEDDEKSRSSFYLIPWTNQISRPITSFYNVIEEPGLSGDIEFRTFDDFENGRIDAFSWINFDNASELSVVKSVPFSSGSTDFIEPSFLAKGKSFQNGSKARVRDIGDIEGDIEGDKEGDKEGDIECDEGAGGVDLNLLYGNHGSILMACFVRLLLISHNILTVWRVTHDYNDNWYWLLVAANFLLIFEGVVVVIKNGGMEYLWWYPCFLIYLASTIPAIWLLQLNQYDLFVNAGKGSAHSPTTSTSSTLSPVNGISKPLIGTLDNDVGLIVIEDCVIYLLVFSRWLLPRGKVTRAFFADLLIEFLAIASDIMEFLAVFDADEIRGNLKLTYVIMALWSASFIQFVPVSQLTLRRFQKTRGPNVECIAWCCGDKFVAILTTCMSIFLQDLPFLVVRLYIIIEVKLITYSLIFFLLKNIVTLLLLSYRLGILCYRLPHCKGTRK